MKKKMPFYFLPKKIVALIIISFYTSFLFAQIPSHGIDVKHYAFHIELNDSNNIVRGNAIITTDFTKKENKVWFDLVNKNKDGKGMTVTSVLKKGVDVDYVQDSAHLIISDTGIPGQENTYTISYEGIPADGLIISNTKYGDRSFFADNWPNRAHNWIPCNDHLSDKATVEFMITAPDHYQVVANGREIEETNLANNLKLSHWRSEIPLPTKVMAIGVTRFATHNMGSVDCVPVSAWVFPEDRDSGFVHYAISKNILQWYINHLAPYPFEKLANVQSKTTFGGLENAGCIFYFENSVRDKGIESLIAHETAHQWFGDNATEKDWPHLWLSEGFATYMTDMYLEDKYGKDTLLNLLKIQRKQVIDYSQKHNAPVVDTSEKNNLMHLLNPNSYQKGGWVLHMLRRRVGDSLFWKAIRTYYKAYAGSNAATTDLEKIFEEITHQNLKFFFRQWLFTPGQPKLKTEWTYNKATKKVSVHIEQTQNRLFEFPLTISFTDGSNTVAKIIEVKDAITQKEFPISFEPKEILLDPEVNLLFEKAGIENKE